MATITITWEYEDNEDILVDKFEIYRDGVLLETITDTTIREYTDDVTTLRDDATKASEMRFLYEIFVLDADGNRSLRTFKEGNCFESLLPQMTSTEADGNQVLPIDGQYWKSFNDNEHYNYYNPSSSDGGSTLSFSAAITLDVAVEFMAWGYHSSGSWSSSDEAYGIEFYGWNEDDESDIVKIGEILGDESKLDIANKLKIKDIVDSDTLTFKNFRFSWSGKKGYKHHYNYYKTLKLFGKVPPPPQ